MGEMTHDDLVTALRGFRAKYGDWPALPADDLTTLLDALAAAVQERDDWEWQFREMVKADSASLAAALARCARLEEALWEIMEAEARRCTFPTCNRLAECSHRHYGYRCNAHQVPGDAPYMSGVSQSDVYRIAAALLAPPPPEGSKP